MQFVRTLRLAAPKLGIGWMFALLTSNFNRIAIHDLGVAAVVVTAMLGLHYFLSPLQVVFGTLADRYPLGGLRRSPYLVFGAVAASLVFVPLPALAVAMGHGSAAAFAAGIALMLVFGAGVAATGDAHHALIAEVTDERTRGGVIAVVWTTLIAGTIIAAGVIKAALGDTYDPARMQMLYGITPLIVLLVSLLGVVGIERRGTASGQQPAAANTASASAAFGLLRDNAQVRTFFGFLLLSILGIFLQDAVLEVFGADVFGMTLRETTTFTQTWGGGVLIGMIATGIVSGHIAVSKKTIALIGSIGTAAGLALLTLCALGTARALLNPALLVMGISTGLFNVGALSLMMEMTVAGAVGQYMGLWGMAQAFGTGLANFVSGAMKSALIESGWLSARVGYATIFGTETVLMAAGVALLCAVHTEAFRGLNRADLARALDTAATA